MISISEKIRSLILEYKHKYNEEIDCPTLGSLGWGNKPWSIKDLNSTSKAGASNLHEMNLKLDMLIDRADPLECEESQSSYIRNCKKWMVRNDFEYEWKSAFQSMKNR